MFILFFESSITFMNNVDEYVIFFTCTIKMAI
jgi:hypothetical protein